ncbi:hypothetical protein, partial [Avibacterium paragallinarum]|uniref:hypothetical protein n=1 Tax=Avibacterium paragallinarum TaxID=728 RepID=UPI001A92C85A
LSLATVRFFGEMLSALIATTRFVAWGVCEMQITGFCCYFILILIYKGGISLIQYCPNFI